MNINEYRAMVKEEITPEEYEIIETAYIAIDLDKRLFCAMINAIGKQEIINKADHFNSILEGLDMRAARRTYERAIARAAEINREQHQLSEIIASYEKHNSLK